MVQFNMGADSDSSGCGMMMNADPMKENGNSTGLNWFINGFIEITMKLSTWAPKYIVISTSSLYVV